MGIKKVVKDIEEFEKSIEKFWNYDFIFILMNQLLFEFKLWHTRVPSQLLDQTAPNDYICKRISSCRDRCQ